MITIGHLTKAALIVIIGPILITARLNARIVAIVVVFTLMIAISQTADVKNGRNQRNNHE